MAKSAERAPKISERLTNAKNKIKEKTKNAVDNAKSKADKFEMKKFAYSTGNTISQFCVITGAAILGTWAVVSLSAAIGIGPIYLAALFLGLGLIAGKVVREQHSEAQSLV